MLFSESFYFLQENFNVWIEENHKILDVPFPPSYQDLHIMDACLETNVRYLDTANYEPPDEARFCHKWQWDYHERFKEKGIMALLGNGFDPGVTNFFYSLCQETSF